MHEPESVAKQPSPSPLSVPIFRTIWIASMVANFGVTMQAVGASWLMTTLSESPVMVALVQAFASLPVMLLSLAAGAIADNLDRRHVMLASQMAMMAASIALAVLAIAGWISPSLLLLFTFLMGCGTAINWPAMQVTLAEIVPVESVPRAVALNGMGVNIARSVGPALAGVIISTFGVAIALALNTVTYLGMIGALLRWRRKPPERLLPPEALGSAMLAGIRYATMSPMIVAVLLRALFYGFCASALQALMPLIARDLLGGNALTFGFLLGSFGFGAVIGALFSARLRARWSPETTVERMTMVGAAGSAIAGFSTYLPLTLLAIALAGASWLITLSTFNVTLQLSAPRWVVARELSLYQTAVFGGVAFGSWSFGSLAAHVGGDMALIVSAVGLCLVALAGRIMPIKVRSRADLQLRTGWQAPETQVPVNMQSGPIVLTTEYRVKPDYALRFTAIMQERSRILRRDGARHWSLGRDLSTPELWTERFHLPTWLDYLHLNQRRTRDDLALMQSLNKILIEGTSPVVHRSIERQSGALPWTRSPDLAMIEASATSG